MLNQEIYCLYACKSSDNEDRQVLSIGSQINEMERTIEKEKLNVIRPLFTETSYAKAPGRQTFNKMLNDIEKGDSANSILCWKLDRLARNFIDGGRIIHLLQRGVIKKIKTYERDYLPSDNVLLMAIEFGVANQYVRDLSVNVKRGQKRKAQLGYPHGMAKIGYANDTREEKGNRKWVKDEIRFPMVKRLFELMLTGKFSVPELWRMTKEEMLLTTPQRKREGGRPIALSYLYTMFADPIYAGFFFYNGERYDLTSDLDRVINEDQYWNIQSILGQKGRPRSRSKSREGLYNYFMRDKEGGSVTPDFKFQVICDCKYKYSYSTKPVCPSCGKLTEQIKNPTHLSYVYYYSTKEKKDRTIKARGIEEKNIDKIVIKEFSDDIVISEALSDWCIKNIAILKDKEVEDAIATGKSFQEGEKTIKRKLNNLLDLRLSKESITDDERETLDEKEAALKRKLEEIKNSVKNKGKSLDWFTEVKHKFSLMAEILEILKNGLRSERRAVIMDFGSNLVLKDGKAFIYHAKEVKAFIDCLKKAKLENPSFEPKKVVDTSEQNEAFASVVPTLLPRQDSNLRPIA